MRAIWLSDVHLGTRGCRADALLDFLEGYDCEYLYLVGDIIDFWKLRRAPYWPSTHSDVVRKVLAKAHAGAIVTFVPGNHDECIRQVCDLQLGNVFVASEAVHRTVTGRLLLILHGDEFDGVTRGHRWVALLGDIGYELLIVLNRWLNAVRGALGLRYFSLAGYVKWKVKRAMMFVCHFEDAIAREAARRGMDGVVCGHVHRAAMRPIGPVLYCNVGDWVESCTALVEHLDGRLELVCPALGPGGRRAEPRAHMAPLPS